MKQMATLVLLIAALGCAQAALPLAPPGVASQLLAPARAPQAAPAPHPALPGALPPPPPPAPPAQLRGLQESASPSRTPSRTPRPSSLPAGSTSASLSGGGLQPVQMAIIIVGSVVGWLALNALIYMTGCVTDESLIALYVAYVAAEAASDLIKLFELECCPEAVRSFCQCVGCIFGIAHCLPCLQAAVVFFFPTYLFRCCMGANLWAGHAGQPGKQGQVLAPPQHSYADPAASYPGGGGYRDPASSYPVSVQPQYGQPQYGQPQYGQPKQEIVVTNPVGGGYGYANQPPVGYSSSYSSPYGPSTPQYSSEPTYSNAAGSPTAKWPSSSQSGRAKFPQY